MTDFLFDKFRMIMIVIERAAVKSETPADIGYVVTGPV